jgi:hypothetical protein
MAAAPVGPELYEAAQEPKGHVAIDAALVLDDHLNECLATGERGLKNQIGAALTQAVVAGDRVEALEVVEVEVGQYLGRQPGAQGGGGVFGPPKDVAKKTIVGVGVESRGVCAWRRFGWGAG